MRHCDGHRRAERRPPVLGVGGLTLLMVVTMVLTGPALGRGAVALERGNADWAVQRATPTDGAGHRLGGRRQLASNQVRPVGGGVIVAMSRPERTLSGVCAAFGAPAVQPVMRQGDRVGVRLLNLPPPVVG
jgi:hypothetical protein